MKMEADNVKQPLSFQRATWGCAYFFFIPSMVYGLLTARMPAIKAALAVDDSQIGLLFLALGCATFAGLMVCGYILPKIGAKMVITVSACALICFIGVATLAISLEFMILGCILGGLCVGLCDVALNAQGIFLEQRYGKFCLSFLHAVSSCGGIAGSLTGSFFAGIAYSPFMNFVIVAGLYLVLMPLFWTSLQDYGRADEKRSKIWSRAPYLVWACGVLGLICHIAEGSVGEWGSIYLKSAKGASQQQAALAFGACTAMMVLSRLYADRLRLAIGNFWLIFGGSMLAAGGMVLVLLTQSPLIALGGYAILGAGIGPVVPVLFSMAGACRNSTPAQASAVVSVFSYAGLLMFPPLLGLVDSRWGVERTLWIIPVCCVLTGLGAFLPGMGGRGRNK